MINITSKVASVLFSLEKMEKLYKQMKKLGGVVDELTAELEQEKETTKFYRLEGRYTLESFRSEMKKHGVKSSKIKGVNTLICDGVTLVGPWSFLAKIRYRDNLASKYNTLLDKYKAYYRQIIQALKELENITPNDLAYSRLTVPEWIDINEFAKKARALIAEIKQNIKPA